MLIQVQCIHKQDRDVPWERIVEIGGRNAKDARWMVSQQRAIQGIESGEWSFYVGSESTRARVVVRIGRDGNKYITTETDGEGQTNLLRLPECC